MFKKFSEYIKANFTWLVFACVVGSSVVFLSLQIENYNKIIYNETDFKSGVQNHLVWTITGECFFVKPLDSRKVLLVRVSDCDKK